MVRLIKTSHVAETTAAFEEGESRCWQFCWQFIDEKRVCGYGKTLWGHAGDAILPRQLGAVSMHRLHPGPPQLVGVYGGSLHGVNGEGAVSYGTGAEV